MYRHTAVYTASQHPPITRNSAIPVFIAKGGIQLQVSTVFVSNGTYQREVGGDGSGDMMGQFAFFFLTKFENFALIRVSSTSH